MKTLTPLTTFVTRLEQKNHRREKYYRRWMREWCRRHKLPYIAAYKSPKHRNEIISLVATTRRSFGLAV